MEPLRYLSHRNEWLIDIPNLIAIKSTTLWLGRGLLFNSTNEKILNYFNNLVHKDKWFEKLLKLGHTLSLLSKGYILLMLTKNNDITLVVLPTHLWLVLLNIMK